MLLNLTVNGEIGPDLHFHVYDTVSLNESKDLVYYLVSSCTTYIYGEQPEKI